MSTTNANPQSRQTHISMVARVVGEMVPMAELVLPVVRKPLIERMTADTANLERELHFEPESACRLLGLQPTAAQLQTLRQWGEKRGQRLLDLWHTLLNDLRTQKTLGVTHFVDGVMGDVIWAMDIQGLWAAGKNPIGEAAPSPEIVAIAKELAVDPTRLEGMVRGELAFRALVAFIRNAEVILDGVQPRRVPQNVGFRRPS